MLYCLLCSAMFLFLQAPFLFLAMNAIACRRAVPDVDGWTVPTSGARMEGLESLSRLLAAKGGQLSKI